MSPRDDLRVRTPFSVWVAGTIEQVTTAAAGGLVDAIVTNPAVIAAWCDGGRRTLHDVVREVIDRSRVPLFIQLRGPGRDAMLDEAASLREISPRVLPKLPATMEGLATTHRLSEQGVTTLVTTICTARQAALFAAAGASHLCPYFSRLNQAGGDAPGLIRDVAERFRRDGVPTTLFPASVRDPEQAEQAWLAGAAGVIVFWDVYQRLLDHHTTSDSLALFDRDDWPRIPLENTRGIEHGRVDNSDSPASASGGKRP